MRTITALFATCLLSLPLVAAPAPLPKRDRQATIHHDLCSWWWQSINEDGKTARARFHTDGCYEETWFNGVEFEGQWRFCEKQKLYASSVKYWLKRDRLLDRTPLVYERMPDGSLYLHGYQRFFVRDFSR